MVFVEERMKQQVRFLLAHCHFIHKNMTNLVPGTELLFFSLDSPRNLNTATCPRIL